VPLQCATADLRGAYGSLQPVPFPSAAHLPVGRSIFGRASSGSAIRLEPPMYDSGQAWYTILPYACQAMQASFALEMCQTALHAASCRLPAAQTEESAHDRTNLCRRHMMAMDHEMALVSADAVTAIASVLCHQTLNQSGAAAC
jgi:hypothetical protein